MTGNIEGLLNLRLSDIKEIQPFPSEKFVLVKSKKNIFKININGKENFSKAVDYIKGFVGFKNEEEIDNRKKKTYMSRIKSDDDSNILFRTGNKTYSKYELIEMGYNPFSINNAVNKGKTYKGLVWEKLILVNGKWILSKDKNKEREHKIRCVETSEIKTYKEWAEILGVKPNTITKNISKHYKTKGLTFERVLV